MNTIAEAIRSKQGAHYYYPDGKPCFEVPNASKGGMRSVTITDAKKLGLYPSVTTILKDIRKHSLEEWKYEQYVLAALTTPKSSGETEKEYVTRIIESANEQSSLAMSFGSEIHSLIESAIATGDTSIDPSMDKRVIETIIPVYAFLAEHGFKGVSEQVVVNAGYKYAGTIDFLGDAFGHHYVVVDFKTQATQQGKKVVYYDEWIYQLAAYGQCYATITMGPLRNLASVVISSTEPGRIEYKIWSDEDAECGWQTFKRYAEAFNLIRGLI